jgi:hypothetical protein
VTTFIEHRSRRWVIFRHGGHGKPSRQPFLLLSGPQNVEGRKANHSSKADLAKSLLDNYLREIGEIGLDKRQVSIGTAPTDKAGLRPVILSGAVSIESFELL